MSVDISVQTNVKALAKKLDAFAYKQLPFATAQALTAIAREIQKGEQAAMSTVFDRPTPFTVNSVGVKPARKDNQEAEVFVKDIAAAYLKPYEVGGVNKLNSKAVLTPIGSPTNQYGNLPRNRLASLKGRANVFVGKIKGKDGTQIDGVWQRIPARKGKPASVKLLIRFDDAHPIKQHLDYRQRAQGIVTATFDVEMGRALAKAIATAK